MSTPKRIIATFLAAALLTLGAVALVGCGGPSDEEIVRQGVTDELDKIKNLDTETIDQMALEVGAAGFENYGIDPKEFVTSYLNGFDYRIDDVTVDGQEATATVVLTCKSFTEYEAALTEAATALAEDESIVDLSQEEINMKYGQVVMDTLAGVSVQETEPLALTFELQDKTWMPTADAQKALADAMFKN